MIEGLCVANVLKRLRVHVVHAEGGDVVPARHQVGVRDVAVVLHQPDPLLELRVDDAPALTGVRRRLQHPRRVDAVPVGVVAGRGDPRARGDGQDRRGGRRGRRRRAGRVAGGASSPVRPCRARWSWPPPPPVSGGAVVVVSVVVGSVEVGSAVVVVDRPAADGASVPGAWASAAGPVANATTTSAANAGARRVHHRMAARVGATWWARPGPLRPRRRRPTRSGPG